jgi:23S rRNA pseudouridine1911/1915/1917 synthase
MHSRSFQVAPAQHGERIDHFLVQSLSGLSRKQIKSVIDAGGVYVNRRRVQKACFLLTERDSVEVYWQDDSAARDRPQLDPAALVYDCSEFLVVNKPAGLPSQATIETTRGTVIEALRTDLGLSGNLLLVHRLDKDTSGLLIVARTAEARGHFEQLFLKRIVQKTYLGLTAGTPVQMKGEISAAIQKDPIGQNRYRIDRSSLQQRVGATGRPTGRRTSNGRPALTHYEVLAAAPELQTALMCFKPRTGRTHQIRVHTAQVLGCPILGDKTYGSLILGHPLHKGVYRHLLHAWMLKFPLPGSGEWLTVEAPPPADFVELCKEAGLPCPTPPSVQC